MADEWYFTVQGQRQGPVSTAQLREYAASGHLQPSDLVWKDGMPNWVPAGDARGLFPHEVAPAAPPAAAFDYEDDYERRPYGRRPLRRARRPEPKGVSAGVLIAIIGGVGAFVLVGVIVVVVLVVNANSGNTPGSYTINLNQGGRDIHWVTFRAGRGASITGTSEMPAQLNVYVFDDGGMQVAADARFARDCFVNFVPSRTERYRIEIVNVGPNFVRAHVRHQ